MNNTPWIFMGTFQNKDFDLLLNNVQIGIQNGVLVLASGRPGVQLRFSFDGKGDSWSEPLDLIPFMHEDGSYNTNVSCSYPAILAETANSFYLVYTDFTRKNDKGEQRKTILFRKILVKL